MGAARTFFVSVTIICALVSTVFGILVLIGGLPRAGIEDIYFLRMNTTDLITSSTSGSAILINAAAHDLGLADYYQTSLWNYCSGNLRNGSSTVFASPSSCTTPSASYWFDPVKIITDSVSSTISFTIPQSVTDDVQIIHTVQSWLKALLIVGTVFSFLTMFACSFAFHSRLGSLVASVVAFIGALFTIVGAILAQVSGIVIKNIMDGLTEIQVQATLGTKFYVLLWIAAGFSLLYWTLILATACCCLDRGIIGDKRRKEAAEKKP